MYKLEMHVHTSPTSRCASAKAEDAVAQYTQAGYHGLVLTNHINNSTYRYMEDMPWNEKVAHFVRGFEDMQRAAAGRLTVLFGCEINLTPLGAPKYIPNGGGRRAAYVAGAALRKRAQGGLSDRGGAPLPL